MSILPRKIKNVLTFDVEEWHEANYPEKIQGNSPGRLEEEVKEILEICREFGTRATFFVLGKAAEKYPELVKAIQADGHEVACHGYSHQMVSKMDLEGFRQDLGRSVRILKSITDKDILGFRAPSWSFDKSTSWAYPILTEQGFKYSSSVFPIKTFLYGFPDSPRFPYRVGDILEIPMSTLRLAGRNFPFSGGAFFRFLPLSIIEKGIKSINKKGQPVLIYLHPREIDPLAPKLELPFKENLVHYWGVNKVKGKLIAILKKFNFGSIEEIYGEKFHTQNL